MSIMGIFMTLMWWLSVAVSVSRDSDKYGSQNIHKDSPKMSSKTLLHKTGTKPSNKGKVA